MPRDHYIPRFILRNFTDQNGHFYCVRKEDKLIFKTSPHNFFLEKDLYTENLEDGTKSTQIETELSQIEGEFSEEINKIIDAARSESNLALDPSDEEKLLRFINCQINRHPYNEELLRIAYQNPEALQTQIEHELGRPLNKEELNKFKDPCLVVRGAFLHSINVPDYDPASWMRYLKQKRIGIYRVRQNAGEFVIGDKQIVIGTSKTRDTNLGNLRIWLLYPISHDVGVVWGLMDEEPKLDTIADSRWVDDINKESFRISRFIAGRSKHQLQSLLNQSLRSDFS